MPFAGGLAVTWHGYVRATDDIDLLVPRAYLPLVKQAARRVSFLVDTPGELVFGRGTPREATVHRVSKLVDGDGIILELMEVNDANRFAWKSRRAHRVEDRTLWAVSRKSLIKRKRLSGRPRDLLDVDGLEGRLES